METERKGAVFQDSDPKITHTVGAIIVKAMSVDKTKRYQSMEELTDALDNVKL